MKQAGPHVDRAPVSDRQVRELDACFAAFHRVLMRSMAPVGTDVPLSAQDYRALLVLADRSPVTMTDFSELIGVPLSTATRTVERLTHKGLATRARIEDDRRVVQVEMTEEGRKLMKVFGDHRLEICRTMLSPLTHGEREIFIELMTKIVQQPTQE
jgi:DNA-binding MarR family transcriptional regulator